jgi:4-hydroxybenzoate polyprenyltransferase
VSRLKLYLELIRFEHTLFALPFAYGGMLLAAGGWPGWRTFFLVTLAMVGARTMAMALNRLIDWPIDALNPRTKDRHLPRGLVKPWETLFLALLGLALLVYAGLSLNPLTARLLPVAVFFLTVYSYTKRFTWLCHYVPGLHHRGGGGGRVDRRHRELRPHRLLALGGGGLVDRRV